MGEYSPGETRRDTRQNAGPVQNRRERDPYSRDPSGRQFSLITMRQLTPFLLALLAAWPSAAQAQKSTIVGSWHGTSTCVDKVKFPACNDEEVIYDVTAVGEDTVTVRADKVVNGQREFMGEFQFGQGPDGSWIAEAETPRYHLRFVITVEGDVMTGRLMRLPDQALSRRMALRRVGTE